MTSLPVLYFSHGSSKAKHERLGYKHVYALAYEGIFNSNDKGEFEKAGNYMVYSNLSQDKITHELLEKKLRTIPDTKFEHDCDSREEFQKLLRHKLTYLKSLP
jgi:hypothetical protein